MLRTLVNKKNSPMLASGAEKWKWFYLYYFVDIGSLFFFSLEKKEAKNPRRKKCFTQSKHPHPHFYFPIAL
jgi:hypothetical protein